MTRPYREELAGRLVSDAEAMIAGRAILDAHGQWELENNRVGGQNPWQREHIMLLGRAALSAAALRQSPSVEEVARRTCHCQGVDFGSYEAQVELVPPDFLRREDGRGICIDVCLALEVTQLWRQGIRTTGCCCGHGKLDPTICVAEDSIPAMRALGYTSCPLMPYRADVFAAKTGWPARKVADLFQGRGGG